jgi:hypothetical protein
MWGAKRFSLLLSHRRGGSHLVAWSNEEMNEILVKLRVRYKLAPCYAMKASGGAEENLHTFYISLSDKGSLFYLPAPKG